MGIKIPREGNDCDISDLFGLHYKVHAETGRSSNISITIMVITLNITPLSLPSQDREGGSCSHLLHASQAGQRGTF